MPKVVIKRYYLAGISPFLTPWNTVCFCGATDDLRYALRRARKLTQKWQGGYNFVRVYDTETDTVCAVYLNGEEITEERKDK